MKEAKARIGTLKELKLQEARLEVQKNTKKQEGYVKLKKRLRTHSIILKDHLKAYNEITSTQFNQTSGLKTWRSVRKEK